MHHCLKCNNHLFYSTVSCFFGKKENGQGCKCPECNGNKKSNTEIFKSRVSSLVGSEYSVIGEYVNNKTKIEMLHNVCNSHFSIRPHDFLKKNGNRCPYCSKSKGEKIIENWLNENHYTFIHGYKDINCKNKKILEFDFRVEITDSSYILIEYDGRLHFEPWDKKTKSLDKLGIQKENDRIKDSFCKNNNIPLFRISFKDNIILRLEKIFNISTTIENQKDE